MRFQHIKWDSGIEGSEDFEDNVNSAIASLELDSEIIDVKFSEYVWRDTEEGETVWGYSAYILYKPIEMAKRLIE
jgi:hypothetical protein